jgi:hypothetical protein
MKIFFHEKLNIEIIKNDFVTFHPNSTSAFLSLTNFLKENSIKSAH